MKEKLSTDRGFTTCRCCGSKNLTEILDLGDHPLPSEYGVSAEHILEAFPLRLNICENCVVSFDNSNNLSGKNSSNFFTWAIVILIILLILGG